MTDRRNARAARLLDPVWHQLQDALDRLYAEVEPGGQCLALNVSVANSDGTVVSYCVDLDKPAQIERRILTDLEGIIDALNAVSIDASVS